MNKLVVGLVASASLVVLGGCAQVQKIDTTKFTSPRTVVITDFPDINSVATIASVVTNWPQYYFAGNFDSFFTVGGVTPPLANVPSNTELVNQVVMNQIVTSPQPISVGSGAAVGAVGGLVGAVIQASAEETQKRAAEFPALVRKTFPDDLRVDLLKALRTSLEAKGVQVRISAETRNTAPRLYWPAKDAKHFNDATIAAGPFADSPPVDADLLIQIVPVALYAAPGPLNNYNQKVGICLAMFDGRTRQFLGWQAFSLDHFFAGHATYSGLVADINNAGPALRNALLSLVPQVVRVINGEHVATGS